MALCKRGAQCCVTTIMRCCYPFKDVSAVSTYSQMLAYSRISVLSSRHYSSSQGKLGVFQRANDRCMNILQQRFPQLYILYTTFVKGFRLMVHDVKETKRIRMKMLTESVPLRELPYHEMKTIILFRKDMIKTIPLIIISIPPFAIFLVFALMCLFPRQLLIRHLWTPQQQQDFQRLYHEQRCQHRDDILKGVAWSIPHVKVWTLRSHLLTLINKMQSGTHPSVTDLHAVRDVFSGIPLGLSDMDWGHMRLMSSHLLLNPWLPGFFLRRRLRAKALDMLYLDQALDTLGQDRLTDTEIREACYLRGLDPSSLTTSQCQEWLQQWLQLSTQLTESETSLLLHNMAASSWSLIRLTTLVSSANLTMVLELCAGYAVVGEEGVQEWAKHTALWDTGVQGHSGGDKAHVAAIIAGNHLNDRQYMTWTIWKCLQSDTSLTLRRTAFMVMEEAYTELYREFLKLRSLCLKQAALLQQLTETLKRRQGEATFSGELGAMPTNAIQCTQEIPGPVPVRPEPPMVQRNIPAKQPEPPLVQIHNTATQHGVIAQSGAVGLLSGVLRQRLDRVHLDLACDGTEKKDVLKLSPFIPVDKPGGNGETVPFSALGDSKQADRFWGNDETREMFRMPSGFGSFLNSDFLRQTGGMMFMSEVALQSQVCDFCHAVFPGHTTTRGDFLRHLHTHIN